jgi:hypothetical protein
MVPEDASGLPSLQGDTAVFRPMEWARLINQEPCLLAIEELPAASGAVRKALASLILERRVGNLPVHEGTKIMVTGNRPEDASGSEHLESHLLSRLVVVTLDPSISDLEMYWMKRRMDPVFPAFWRWSPESFDTFDPKRKAEPYACGRSWEALSDILPHCQDDDTAMLAAEGCVGRVGPAFLGFRRMALSQSVDDWLNDPKTPLPTGEKLYALAVSISHRAIERKKEREAFTVALGMPLELSVLVLKAIMGRSEKERAAMLQSTPEYTNLRNILLPVLKGGK